MGSLKRRLERVEARGGRPAREVAASEARWALDALYDAIEAYRRGEELPASEATDEGDDALALLERSWAGDEEACREWWRRDGYRRWG